MKRMTRDTPFCPSCGWRSSGSGKRLIYECPQCGCDADPGGLPTVQGLLDGERGDATWNGCDLPLVAQLVARAVRGGGK